MEHATATNAANTNGTRPTLTMLDDSNTQDHLERLLAALKAEMRQEWQRRRLGRSGFEFKVSQRSDAMQEIAQRLAAKDPGLRGWKGFVRVGRAAVGNHSATMRLVATSPQEGRECVSALTDETEMGHPG